MKPRAFCDCQDDSRRSAEILRNPSHSGTGGVAIPRKTIANASIVGPRTTR